MVRRQSTTRDTTCVWYPRPGPYQIRRLRIRRHRRSSGKTPTYTVSAVDPGYVAPGSTQTQSRSEGDDGHSGARTRDREPPDVRSTLFRLHHVCHTWTRDSAGLQSSRGRSSVVTPTLRSRHLTSPSRLTSFPYSIPTGPPPRPHSETRTSDDHGLSHPSTHLLLLYPEPGIRNLKQQNETTDARRSHLQTPVARGND